jgi:hypothetical protein
VSLLEQYTIDCEYLAHFYQNNFFLNIEKKEYKRDIMQLFSADAAMFLKNINIFLLTKTWKNRPQKLLIIGPKFFSVLPTGRKSAQISYSVP